MAFVMKTLGISNIAFPDSPKNSKEEFIYIDAAYKHKLFASLLLT